MMTRCMYAPTYKLIPADRTAEDGSTYTAYGITYSRRDFFGGCTVRTIEDISSDPELVGGMVNLFNACCLSLDGFENSVIDLIS